MKKYTVLCFVLLETMLFAQKDTSYLLPTAEIITTRFNAFSLGQTQITSDSLTLSLYRGQSLADYLQAETPLSIKTYGTGLASMTMRGLTANQTAVLWNGINLQNPLNGGSDLALFDAQSIDQIDVKLGGCSALFGSGAMGGMIQLIDNQAKETGIHGQAGYGYGSTRWQNSYAQLRINKNKMGASVKVAYQEADNDFNFKNTAEIGQPLKKAIHAGYHFFNVNTSFYYDISKHDRLKIHYWRSQNFREITPTMTSSNSEAIYRDTANRIVGEWTHFFKKSFLKIRTAYVYDKNFYQSNVVKNSQNGIYTSVGEVEWNYSFSEKHQIRTGFNTTFDKSANNNYKQTHQRTRMAFFINDVFKTRFMDLTGSLRQEWVANKITPTTFLLGFEKNVLKIPQSITQNLKSSLILRGSLSRNFSVPTFNDLYWANLGNPNLLNEQGLSKELGVSFKQQKHGKALQAHLTFFDIDIKNRIVWLPQNDGQWRPTNLNKVSSRGIETWANYALTQGDFQYKISLNYQLAHAVDGSGGAQLYAPKHKGGMSAWGQYKAAYISWQQTASGRRFATTDRTTWTKPFTLADLTIGYTPSVLGLKIDMRFVVSNVLNVDYQVIPFYPNPKRQFRLNIGFNF